jgi:hypothetical protein
LIAPPKKQCRNCGSEVPESARACHYCQYRFARGARLWRIFGPAATTVVAIASVVIAVYAARQSNSVAHAQQALGQRAEEETSAPILVTQLPAEQRGHRVTLPVNFPEERLTKFVGELYLEPDTSNDHRARIVVPVTNAGPGVAFTVGLPILVSRCTVGQREIQMMKPISQDSFGIYAITGHSTEQLVFLAPRGAAGTSEAANIFGPNGQKSPLTYSC